MEEGAGKSVVEGAGARLGARCARLAAFTLLLLGSAFATAQADFVQMRDLLAQGLVGFNASVGVIGVQAQRDFSCCIP